MLRLRQSLAPALAAWLALAALALAAWFALSSLARAADETHQVLVMVRLQPAHARPNSDYAGGYGGSVEQAERRHIAERLARRYGLMLEQNWPMPLVGVDCFVMDVPQDRSPADVAERLSREPDVAWSEPMNLYHAQE